MLLIFISLILFLFALILLVFFDPHNAFDQYLIACVQQYDVSILERGAVLLSYVGSLYGTAVIAFLLLIYSLVQHKTKQAFILVFGFASTVSVTWLMKWLFARPRPLVVDEALVETYGSAFPSAHSAYAAMIAVMFVLVLGSNRNMKYWMLGIAVIWAVLIGWSRVYLSAHYPTDVLAGWVVAMLMMILSTQLMNKFLVKQHD